MNPQLITTIILPLLISLVATHFLIKILRKKQILDRPNKRSSHKIAVPRGGGLAFMAAIYISFATLFVVKQVTPIFAYILLTSLFLAIISWFDDMKSLSAKFRLLTQIIAVSATIYFLNILAPTPTLGGLIPLWADHIFTAIALIWFINLYNFMDGIDGITASQTIAVCVGMIVLLTSAEAYGFAIFPIVIASALVGFLYFNWHPAKIFMGDVGSIALGYIIGVLLILLAKNGFLISAIILPLYYLADSTITIVKRLLAGKKIWQAHCEHFYQQAVRNGKKHSSVVKTISFANFFLIICAIIATNENYSLYALAASIVVIAILLCNLKKKHEN